MIQIDDYDLPITAAEKIIRGTRPAIRSALAQAVVNSMIKNGIVPQDKVGYDTEDMFDLEELEEIAQYLTVYCQSHKRGD